ncbi:MAG: hypothetical protein HC871_16815 [Rhizobiales bacterium]|nr:hypothetical protein [Hyphomicrobiales bacterium]
MVALIAQTWLVPLALATAGSELGGLVICTGTGYKVIPSPTGDDFSSDIPAKRSAGFDCIACLHGVLGQAGLASAALLPMPVKHAVVSFRAADQRSPSAPGFGAARSRSPPIV